MPCLYSFFLQVNPAPPTVTQEIVTSLTSDPASVASSLANQDTESALGNVLVYGGVLNDQGNQGDVTSLQEVSNFVDVG